MRNALVLVALAVVALGSALISSPDRAGAAFHLMRIYAVGGGAFADPDVQWVELRMANAGQNFVTGHHLCFYDADGDPYARFTFPTLVNNGADEASILIGSPEFDDAWAAGSPDFEFSAATTVALGAGAEAEHPVVSPSGKVSFGTDGTSTPSLMCQGSFTLIDSVAYGSGYTGGVDYGSAFAGDLPTADTDALRLQGLICIPGSTTPCPQPRDNSADYDVDDVNTANNPRNNSDDSGPLSQPGDDDGDGVPNGSDNCPAWPNPGQGLPSWTVPAGDSDCDGFADSVSPGLLESEAFMGTDPVDACADTTTLFDERGPMFGEPVSPWPVDTNDDRNANFGDILLFAPHFLSNSGDANYWERFDWNGDGSINFGDVLQIAPFFLQSCTP